MNPGEIIQILAVATVVLFAGGLGATLIRWLWKRTDRPALPGNELEELQARVAELEAERGRVAELEERLDFAERLLARQTDPDRIGDGR